MLDRITVELTNGNYMTFIRQLGGKDYECSGRKLKYRLNLNFPNHPEIIRSDGKRDKNKAIKSLGVRKGEYGCWEYRRI